MTMACLYSLPFSQHPYKGLTYIDQFYEWWPIYYCSFVFMLSRLTHLSFFYIIFLNFAHLSKAAHYEKGLLYLTISCS